MDPQIVSEGIVTVNFRGQEFEFQGWKFDILLHNPLNWVSIGDTYPNTNGWNSWQYVIVIII